MQNEPPGEDNVEKLNFSHIYYCSTHYPVNSNSLIVRVVSGDPMALVPAIKRAVQELNPDEPIGATATMEKNIGASLSARRLTMTLLGSFAGLALLLASLGLYGVMALSVTQRTREMGIRMALGAARADVFRLVLGQGLGLIGAGLGFGLLGALAAGRALASVLYGVGAIDFVALAVAIGSLTVVALLACFVPARRTTRVDPMIALREELASHSPHSSSVQHRALSAGQRWRDVLPHVWSRTRATSKTRHAEACPSAMSGLPSVLGLDEGLLSGMNAAKLSIGERRCR